MSSEWENRRNNPQQGGGYDTQQNDRYGTRQSGAYGTQQESRYGTRQSGAYNTQQGSRYGTRRSGAYDTQQENRYGTRQNGAYNTQQGNRYGTRQNGAYNTQQGSRYGTRQSGAYNTQQNGRYYNSTGYTQQDRDPGVQGQADRPRSGKKKTDPYRLVKILVGGIAAGLLIGGIAATVIKGRSMEKAATEYEARIQSKDDEIAALQEELESNNEENAQTNAEILSGQEDGWALALVNETYPLDTSYAPELTQLDDTHSVDSRIAEETQQMFQDAQAAGLNLYIVSAYRSYDQQREVFNTTMNDWIAQGYTPLEAYEETAKSVAIPGTSEHATGLALDITSGEYEELDDRQAETDEAKWLAENCWKYGFILRYPSEKSDVTGIVYEPWHYRYVGKDAAQKITEQGVTLEEYLENQ